MTFSNLYRIFYVEKEWHKFLLVPISIKKSFFKKSSTPLELERASWISPNKDWYEGGGPYRGKKKNEIRSSTNLYHHQYFYSSYSHGTSQFNTLHPNISMKILHTVRYTFHFVLTMRIFLRSKLLRLWSFSLFSWSKWTIHQYYCKEKLEAGHS